MILNHHLRKFLAEERASENSAASSARIAASRRPRSTADGPARTSSRTPCRSQSGWPSNPIPVRTAKP